MKEAMHSIYDVCIWTNKFEKCTHTVTMLAHFLISVNLKNYTTYRKRISGTKHKLHIPFFLSKTFICNTLLSNKYLATAKMYADTHIHLHINFLS